jgi:hypothetical protein
MRLSLFRSFAIVILLPAAIGALLASCGSVQQPYHGFPDQGALDTKDTYVLRESVGGALDPTTLAQADQMYDHHNIAFNQIEEGYYQWGQKLYALGYRDVFYIRDLAPRAMHHALMDTYDHAIETGFDDAVTQNTSSK